jgi:hypothetical protein
LADQSYADVQAVGLRFRGFPGNYSYLTLLLRSIAPMSTVRPE